MKTRPVWAACATAAAVVLSASACSNPTDSAAGQQKDSAGIVAAVQKNNDIAAMLPEDIKARGKITIAISPDVEPVKFLDADGNVAGANPDLLRAATKVLGIEAEFQRGTFDSMLPGLEAERYDVLASLGDYKERQGKIDFIDYLRAGDSILVSTKLKTEVKSPEDLCGLRVGYVRGNSQERDVDAASKACVAAGKPAVIGSAYPDGPTGILAVKSDQDDALWGDLGQNAYNAKKDPQAFKISYTSQDSFFGIGVNKKDTQLRDALRAALTSLAKSGEYEELLKQWGLESYGLPEFPLNADVSLKAK
jgi:polar amino acid transport system substrate-binding protein